MDSTLEQAAYEASAKQKRLDGLETKRHDELHAHGVEEKRLLTKLSKDQGVMIFPPRTRPKELPCWEIEGGVELKLGDFAEVKPLTVSEARLALYAIRDRRKKDGENMDSYQLQRIIYTFEQVDAFARYHDRVVIEAAERLRNRYTNLAEFERIQLDTLRTFSAEEAKTLIPSLDKKIEDGPLTVLIDELEKLLDSER